MNKYENYKEVNLTWIKKIPGHWDIEKINALFSERKEKNIGSHEKFILSVMKDRGVIPYNEKGNVGNKASENIENYKLVYPDDIVLNCMNMMIGSLGKSEYKGVLSQVYYVLKLINSKCDIDYLSYSFKNKKFHENLRVLGKGILDHRLRVPMEKLKYELLPIPTLSEQRQIVKYLDWKIGEIDKLIELEKQKIEKLETLKQKYIDNIFDSLYCRKYLRLAKLGDFSKGGGFSRENLTNSINEAILYGDIYTKYNYWLEKCVSTIDDKGFKDAKYLQEPAVLFTASGETKEDIGKAVAFIGNHKIAVGGDVIIFRVKKDINVKYISYFCNTSKIKYEKYIESSGEIIVHISSESLKDIKIPFITLEEQEDIVSKIDSFIELQNKIISSKNIIIENYMKLKQSLISEVVTGQIDVRNVKIPERK